MADLKNLQQEEPNESELDFKSASEKLNKAILSRIKKDGRPKEDDDYTPVTKQLLDIMDEINETVINAAKELLMKIDIKQEELDTFAKVYNQLPKYQGIDWETFNTSSKIYNWLEQNDFKNNVPDDGLHLISCVASIINARKQNVTEFMQQFKDELEAAESVAGAEPTTIYDLMRKYIAGILDIPAPISIENILPRLQSVFPKKHTIPNNALANSLQHGTIGSGENARTGDLTVGRKGKQEITTLVSVNYAPESGVSIKSTNYTEFDRQVQNAIVSLWLYGDESHIITPPMVARALGGRNDSVTPSAQFLGAITKSIEKQRRIDVQINATDEIESILKSKGQEMPSGTTAHWREFLLSLKILDVKSGKRKVTAYLIKDEPVLLQYAQLTGQLLSVKSSLLNIKEVTKKIDSSGNVELDKNGNEKLVSTDVSLSNSIQRASIKGYLLRRVEVIKHEHKAALEALRKYNERRKHKADLPEKTLDDFVQMKPVILFDSIFTDTEINTKDRGQLFEYRKYILAVLDYWKAEKHIYGYTLQRKPAKGNPITGIIIEFND